MLIDSIDGFVFPRYVDSRNPGVGRGACEKRSVRPRNNNVRIKGATEAQVLRVADPSRRLWNAPMGTSDLTMRFTGRGNVLSYSSRSWPPEINAIAAIQPSYKI